MAETNEFADVLSTIAEDLHLTRCDQVCFTGTEDDQVDERDHGTSDEVLGDAYMEQGGHAPEETDRDAELLEEILPLVHQETKWVRCIRDH